MPSQRALPPRLTRGMPTGDVGAFVFLGQPAAAAGLVEDEKNGERWRASRECWCSLVFS